MNAFPLHSRRQFLAATATGTSIALGARLPAVAAALDTGLIASIETTTLRRNRDGSEGTTWFHPRACMIPLNTGAPLAFMTLQPIYGSDHFGPVHESSSTDNGRTWSEPRPVSPLGRIPVPDHEGLEAGVCDVVPEYHPKTRTTLAMGHVVFYRGPKFSRVDQLARYPVYAVRREDGSWSERKILEWNDPRGTFIYTNNCGQRVTLPDGDIIMSFTFGSGEMARMVAGVRCGFDGETLKIKEVGPALVNNKGRGLLEPSVTEFKGRFYLTIRAEDERGYVSVSEDGLNYPPQKPWAWDDDEPLTLSTTQQHWLTHSDGLFLVYTRMDKSNTGVIRWRSPLWLAQVDPEKLCLIRSSERIVFPLVGDGVNRPDEVPLMGNFHTTAVSRDESWVTEGEWIPKQGARGNLLMAKIRWTKPNATFDPE